MHIEIGTPVVFFSGIYRNGTYRQHLYSTISGVSYSASGTVVYKIKWDDGIITEVPESELNYGMPDGKYPRLGIYVIGK